MKNFIELLEIEFIKNSNKENAINQKAYMRNQFDFFGISSPIRKNIQKEFLKKNYPQKIELEKIIVDLWHKPQREYQYFSQELLYKFVKKFKKKDIEFLEFMIINKSWWDTIDFIVPKLVGEYFKQYSKQRNQIIKKWIKSQNIWLQRSAIIFQLNYKEKLDKNFLEFIIKSLLGSDEFFINKSIGWILRNYGKINPSWVIDFVEKTNLSSLSRREALRIIIKKGKIIK